MKTVLCYGNSLTWGYDAESLVRHALADRWPSVLQAALGDGVDVIAEGLNGRTTAFDDHLAGRRPQRRAAAADAAGHARAARPRHHHARRQRHEAVDLTAMPVAAKQGMERLVDIVRGHDYPFDCAAAARS